MRLDDRIALVTGGGSGIGRAIARRLAAEGADVAICGRNAATLEQAADAMRAEGLRVQAIPADVADSASVGRMFDAIGSRHGRLDILVNNAGIGIEDLDRFNRTVQARGAELSETGSIRTRWDVTRDMSDAAWLTMIAVHLNGTFFCSREALKLMGAGGAIVNMASTAALAGQEGAPHYSAAKAGVLGFTRALAREVASQGIRVNALAPGFVDTAMSDGYAPGFKRGTIGRIPAGRWGTADEVAAAALFLASDDGAYFTGQCLSPNGGIFMS